MAHEVTHEQLQHAFRASRLWHLGWTFERAMSVPALRTSIECTAVAAQRRAAGSHQQTTAQLGLGL